MTPPHKDMSLSEGLHAYGKGQSSQQRSALAAAIVNKEVDRLKKQLSYGGDLRQDAAQDVLHNLYTSNTYKGQTDAQASGYIKQCLVHALNTKLRKEQPFEALTGKNQPIHTESNPTTPEDDLRFKEQKERIKLFFGPVMQSIAKHVFSRADGRDNFLKNVEHMLLINDATKDKEALIQAHMLKTGIDDHHSARNAIDQSFTRTRKHIHKVLSALEEMCQAEATPQTHSSTPSPKALRAAQALHKALIECEELEDFQRMAMKLRIRRAATPKN